MTTPLVTVVIPTIKPRKMFLTRAVNSILAQDMKGRAKPEIEIALDREHEGAAATRNRALSKVRTPWVAFLDDDDYMLPHHLAMLLASAEEEVADVVYPECRVIGSNNEEIDLGGTLSHGLPFSEEALRQCNYIPVTSLVRTSLAVQAQFGPPAGAKDSQYEDYGFYLRLLDLGAHFHHLMDVTWVWHHHSKQTAGQGNRW